MLAYLNPFTGAVEQWTAALLLDCPVGGLSTIDLDGCPQVIEQLISRRAEFHAHNAQFERHIWNEVCVNRLGWPEIPLDLWHCTAAKAAYANQPRALANVAKRLDLPSDKVKSGRGKLLIARLSKPKKVSKKTPENAPHVTVDGKPCYWSQDPNDHNEFQEYNRQDVIAEMAVDERLPPWPEAERKVWLLDRTINERGIPVDVALCKAAMRIHAEAIARADKAITELTDGKVTRCTQTQRLLEWINARINFGSTLREADVSAWLAKEGVPDDVRAALTLRSVSASNAVRKYKAALAFVDTDNRVREQTRYYGAATGRWSGAGVQPHNFARSKSPDPFFFDVIKTGNYDTCAIFADCVPKVKNVIGLLKESVRGIVTAPPGRLFVVSDFAGIESRVLHWLAGNERMLGLFREGQDVYIDSACDIFGIKPEQIANWTGKKWKIKEGEECMGFSCSSMRQLGKCATLGLGYGMGPEKFQATVKLMEGLDLDTRFVEQIVETWRLSNPEVTRLWKALQKACVFVIKNKKPVKVGRLQIRWDRLGYLVIRLPSGRELFYYGAKLVSNGGFGDEINYLDGSKKSEDNPFVKTYGGKLCENIIQAASRDLLVHSMQLIDADNLDLILHVHDESVVECDEVGADKVKAIVHNHMQTIPAWADGLPLAAETHITKRYTK